MKRLDMLLQILMITIGAAIMGFGINAFNIANNLAEGGVAGVAVVLKLGLGLNPGLTLLVINVPLLIWGYKELESRSLCYTIYGVLVLALFLWGFESYQLPLDDILLAALFAEKGYTGPEHVIDGKEGLAQCLGPEWKLNVLVDGLGDTWRIERCGMKAFPTEALTHTPISAVLDIVMENDLSPDDVTTVRIRSLARAADILADPSKYDPRSKETADHSLPYVIAAAIVDRQMTPAQLTPEKIMDPTIRAQLHKVEVIADPEIEKVFPALQRVDVEIDTEDGRTFSTRLDYPKGDPRNPLTDAEIEAKFDALVAPVLTDGASARLKEAVWSLEQLGSVTELMALAKSDR